MFPATDSFAEQQAHLAMRAIGDELLSYNQDFDTPVQPIEEIANSTLSLKFEQAVIIDPDKLADLALKLISPEITAHSILNVVDATTQKVVYGFEIDRNNPKDIPCLGRLLPKANYHIELSIHKQKAIPLNSRIVLESLLGALVLFLLSLLALPLLTSKQAESQDKDLIKIQGAQLDFRANEILLKDKRIKLTSKEAEILKILIDHEGQLVSRDYLTQEVWLKNGVVTSRSLDMYISRLRKKIKDLPNAQILNKHGKGYIMNV